MIIDHRHCRLWIMERRVIKALTVDNGCVKKERSISIDPVCLQTAAAWREWWMFPAQFIQHAGQPAAWTWRFVVDATEGVMPQTREHLHILELGLQKELW